MPPDLTSGWLGKVMFTSSETLLIGPHWDRFRGLHLALHNSESSRQAEVAAIRKTGPYVLMQRAGLASASWALALAPHARSFWIACGPGNNGGDGLLCARHLLLWGKNVTVTLLESDRPTPIDAQKALEEANAAGIKISHEIPYEFDVAVDALFGIGGKPELTHVASEWVGAMQKARFLNLAIDVPTGLNASTGARGSTCVKADHTLSLLTLKAGLFTASGRDASGQIWFNSLGIEDDTGIAALNLPQKSPARLHATHKGSYGDVAVVGGATGMAGAAILAARAALHAGAGRVFLSFLHETSLACDPVQPELMVRSFHSLDLQQSTVVCGCGGGHEIRPFMADLLRNSFRLVIDADGLNAIADISALQDLLKKRSQDSTVLTPHPLEAARLLGTSVHEIQNDRLGSARAIAEMFQCAVILKGSGSVISAPGRKSLINPTGNPRLASAGTGDVLAGLAGAVLSQKPDAYEAASIACFLHGLSADNWISESALTADSLARSLHQPY